MKLLSSVRKFVFMILLVAALVPSVSGEEAYFAPCPLDYCGIAESCPGPAGCYYSYTSGGCESSACGCQLTGWCGEGGMGDDRWLCYCEACYS